MLIKTPRQFSILAAFMLSLLSVVAVELTLSLSGVTINQRYILIMFVILLISSYLVIYYLLEKLITQKISLLYRMIHNFKINTFASTSFHKISLRKGLQIKDFRGLWSPNLRGQPLFLGIK